jgi:cell wall-associated NlpC family hydrolase
MRHGVWLLLLGLVAAALGAASAYAAGTATTTTTTTTAATTTTTTTDTTSTTTTATTPTTSATPTTGATTTTPSTSYSRLTPSYLSKACVGAGAAAIAEPGRQVLALGTPASGDGPSEYPTEAPIVRFRSSSAIGTACTTTHVALGSVSLFGGVVTASSVEATHGRGAVGGLEIYGSAVKLGAGHTVRIGGWGEVTLGKTVGRLTAPLVFQLLTAHRSLPAGTTIAIAFSASPEAGHTSQTHKKAQTASKTQQPAKPPPDFPVSPSPFAKDGGFTEAAEKNPVVAIAMQYLGVRYQWGGASPKTGFDCSGLVMYVFAKLGVPLIHFAAAQWHSPGGIWVPPNQLRAGDLVFFVGSDGTRKAPGHVGIYVDDGYFIDAPHTGSFVRVDRLTERKFANGYVGARRIPLTLLDTRHLLHVTRPDASAMPFGLPPFLRDALGIAAVRPTAAQVSATESDIPLLVGGPVGGVLALSAIAAGALTFRRRRRTAPDASG